MNFKFVFNVVEKEMIVLLRQKNTFFAILVYLALIFFYFSKMPLSNSALAPYLFGFLSFVITIFFLSSNILYYEKASSLLEFSLFSPLSLGEMLLGKTIFILMVSSIISFLSLVILSLKGSFHIGAYLPIILVSYALLSVIFIPIVNIIGFVQLFFGQTASVVVNIALFAMLFKSYTLVQYFTSHKTVLIGVILVLYIIPLIFINFLSPENVLKS